jgi:hypothetical protein
MSPLIINTTDKASIQGSFDAIAQKLFHNYLLKINDVRYRLIDIEFYFHSEENYKDVYTHQHINQLTSGKWYFHGSGIDITIGTKTNHGGILIRAIAKISENADPGKFFIEKEIHGPLNVKTEICSNLKDVFVEATNEFRLQKVHHAIDTFFVAPNAFYKTRRIGLNKDRPGGNDFHDAPLRYVIFPSLKLRDKTQIAKDMLSSGTTTVDQINKLLGSKFL